jgi:hypothetical protein
MPTETVKRYASRKLLRLFACLAVVMSPIAASSDNLTWVEVTKPVIFCGGHLGDMDDARCQGSYAALVGDRRDRF